MTALLLAENHRRMPWKNGGGVTTEIAVHPEGAGLDAFEWRLSMALVASDGPFSVFPGIDRVLAVLEGEGLSLAINAAPPLMLTPASPPLAFAADAPVSGTLAAGPVTDLNLMVRRGTPHSMSRIELESGRSTLAVRAAHTLLFSPQGGIAVDTPGERFELGPLDALHIEARIGSVALAMAARATLFVVEIG